MWQLAQLLGSIVVPAIMRHAQCGVRAHGSLVLRGVLSSERAGTMVVVCGVVRVLGVFCDGPWCSGYSKVRLFPGSRM